MKNEIVNTYLIYLPVAIVLVFAVARIFFRNSKIFMLDIFRGRQEIAMSTNRLFEVGFYLLNLGFALFYMKIVHFNYEDVIENGKEISKIIFTKQDMFETLSYKIGVLSVFLGLMVFFNLYLLFRGKKKSSQNARPIIAEIPEN